RERLALLPYELRYGLGLPVPYEQRSACYRCMYVRVSRAYTPSAYNGKIAFLARHGTTEWHRKRWTPVALGGLAIREIPAGHKEMVWPPYSDMIAEHFDVHIDGAMG